ncbi:MAG: hypothetical protein PHT94_04790 [Candidatus Nanoarchaeia archaeon]|nr:hypothetical protein [Candidatus Nanoarchaeia archaeon]
MKRIRVILSKDAEVVYKYLNSRAINSKNENMILSSFHKKIDLIKSNVHYGNPISKKLIPEEYKIKYEISNLFRVELPNYWRMLYTLRNGDSEIEIIAFILDIVNHKDYDKKFGYKS